MKSIIYCCVRRTPCGSSVSLWLLLIGAWVLAPTSAWAESRIALVIGNGAYQDAPLKNPVNDAQDMAAKLQELGFQVIGRFDADRQTLRQALREFEQRLRQQRGVGLFYYAGHGVQLKGQNYLIPVGVDIRQEFEVPDEALDADAVLRAMEAAGNDLNIVILDACRNNPFGRGFGGGGRGLARMEGPVGTFIAYATAPGAISQDGNGRNSPYTRSLLAAMGTPGLSLEQIFKQVLIAVEQETKGAQIPWVASSLRGDFYFNPVATATALPTTNTVPAAASNTQMAASKEPVGRPVDQTSAASILGSTPTGASEPVSKPGSLEPVLLETNSTGVAISRSPVSMETYRQFADAAGRAAPPSDASKSPPARVTWQEAMDYAAWLSTQTGRRYRLPTEIEWERAVQNDSNRSGFISEEREWTCSEYRKHYEGQEQRCAERLPDVVSIRGSTWRAGADPLSDDLVFRVVRLP